MAVAQPRERSHFQPAKPFGLQLLQSVQTLNPPPRGVNQPFPKCGPEVQKFQRTPQGFSSRGRFLAPALGAGGGTGFGGGAFGNSNTQGETAAASFAKGGTLSRFQLCAVPTDCVIISHSGPAFLSAAASAGFNKKKKRTLPAASPQAGCQQPGSPPPPRVAPQRSHRLTGGPPWPGIRSGCRWTSCCTAVARAACASCCPAAGP